MIWTGVTRQRVADSVDVWSVELDQSAPCAHDDRESLSAQERDRADAFAHDVARARFVCGRAALRAILAHYIGGHPRDISLRDGPFGKPELAGPAAAAALDFNVSHSGATALIAVARDRCVGIDIERVRCDFDLAAIVDRFFSPLEQRDFSALPPSLQPAGFYRAWTSKEAYLKGLGAGLHLALDGFDVCVDPRRPPRLLRPHAAAPAAFALYPAPVPAGFAGTIAISL